MWRISESAIDAFLHPQPPVLSEPDPLADVNTAIAKEGLCTRTSEKDQHLRDNEGRPNHPPQPHD
jgi:hypothetical protein